MLLGTVDLENGREGAAGIGAGVGGVADPQDPLEGRPGLVRAEIDDDGERQARVPGHRDGKRGRGGVAGGGGEADSRAARDGAFAHERAGKALAVRADPLGGGCIAAVAAGIGPDRHRRAIIVRKAIGPQPKLEGAGEGRMIGGQRLDRRLPRGGDGVRIDRAVRALGPRSPGGHPGNEGVDLRLGEPAVGGHLEAIGVVHCPDEEAFKRRLPRIDRWARVAPADQASARVEPQSPLRLLPCMAGMAALDEERADDSLEGIVGRVGRARRRGENHSGQNAGHASHSRDEAECITERREVLSHGQSPPLQSRGILPCGLAWQPTGPRWPQRLVTDCSRAPRR